MNAVRLIMRGLPQLHNYQSSLEKRDAYRMPRSCGIFEEDSEKAAAAFYEKVLKPKEDLTLYSRLAHLEHRRWMACSVMRGWDMYDADEMDKVTLHNDGSFKDAARKLHPCMTECLDQISLPAFKGERIMRPQQENHPGAFWGN